MDVDVAMFYFKWLFQNLTGKAEENHKTSGSTANF
jgi:hypothetical protein